MAKPDALADIARSSGLAPPRAVPGFGAEPCWAIAVPGAVAVAAWQSLRDAADTTGHWPVIVGNFLGPEAGGSDAVIEAFAEAAQEIQASQEPQGPVPSTRRTTADILIAANELPFAARVARQRDPAYQIDKNLGYAAHFDRFPGAEQLAKLHRQWAEDWRTRVALPSDDSGACPPPKLNKNPPQHELHCLRWFDSVLGRVTVADSITVLCVPTVHGWQVPAHLFYEHPQHELPAQVHVAALRWLHDQFGAELIGLQDRTLEFLPRRRPATWTEAVRAADLLCAYSHCPATSENEGATTAELAVFLLQSTYWSCCWP
jgi:hypothetical protein